MLSSINSRAIVPVACAVTGFVIACCVLLFTFVKDDLIRGEIHHAADLADTVIKSTRYAMLHDDRETLSNIISSIGDQNHHLKAEPPILPLRHLRQPDQRATVLGRTGH